jgi:hypothetical protein
MWFDPDMSTGVTGRVERLNVAAARRIIEPDVDLPGSLGPGRVLPDELLSVHGLDLDLTEEQRIRLGREELAASLRSGILFEAILEAGFAMQIAKSDDVTDPRITFLLHEIGEETRHQRIFQRLVQQLAPTAKRRQVGLVDRVLEAVGPHLIIALPALFHTLVLAGEEIPDLLQRRSVEHPDTDPFLKEVNRYHRAEEARHLSYARSVFPEVWEGANRIDEIAVQRVAPWVVNDMFRFLVGPGVYETVGLPGQETWEAVQQLPQRRALLNEAMRNVLDVLVDAGALRPGRLPAGWQQVCGVDAHGRPAA